MANHKTVRLLFLVCHSSIRRIGTVLVTEALPVYLPAFNRVVKRLNLHPCHFFADFVPFPFPSGCSDNGHRESGGVAGAAGVFSKAFVPKSSVKRTAATGTAHTWKMGEMIWPVNA